MICLEIIHNAQGTSSVRSRRGQVDMLAPDTVGIRTL